MVAQACLRRSLRSSRRACVMVCQRSRVMAVSVKTDSSLANTCGQRSTVLKGRKQRRPPELRLLTTHREEAGCAAAWAHLPVHSMVVVAALREQVFCCYDYQVDAHAEVSKGQVAHQETGDSQLGAAACGMNKAIVRRAETVYRKGRRRKPVAHEGEGGKEIRGIGKVNMQKMEQKIKSSKGKKNRLEFISVKVLNKY